MGGCGFYYPIAPLLVVSFVVQGTFLKSHYVFIFSITCVKEGIVWGALCKGFQKFPTVLLFKTLKFTHLHHL